MNWHRLIDTCLSERKAIDYGRSIRINSKRIDKLVANTNEKIRVRYLLNTTDVGKEIYNNCVEIAELLKEVEKKEVSKKKVMFDFR